MKNFLKVFSLILVFGMAMMLNRQLGVSEAQAVLCAPSSGVWSDGEHEFNETGNCYSACSTSWGMCWIDCNYNYWCSGCPSDCQ